jgi:2-polyprenyl-3-methyl-5-hydroxy-6-metoxy-1,4-benzoquinol methylase
MPDFSRRSTQPEWMDAPDADPALLHSVMDELVVVNKWLGGNDVVLQALGPIAKAHGTASPLRILDVGCGGGDTLLAIARWAASKKLDIELLGIDYSLPIVQYAQRRTAGYPNIAIRQMDLWSDAFTQMRYDVVVNSLFCHHFTDTELPLLLARMHSVATRAVVINDLERHPAAYYGFVLFWHLFLKSPMVRNDGPLSVLRALNRREWQAILQAAGIDRYRLRWRWAFRWQIVIPVS